MKVDDDVFVNPENILTLLRSTELHSVKLDTMNHSIQYAFIGKMMENIPPIREGSLLSSRQERFKIKI